MTGGGIEGGSKCLVYSFEIRYITCFIFPISILYKKSINIDNTSRFMCMSHVRPVASNNKFPCDKGANLDEIR